MCISGGARRGDGTDALEGRPDGGVERSGAGRAAGSRGRLAEGLFDADRGRRRRAGGVDQRGGEGRVRPRPVDRDGTLALAASGVFGCGPAGGGRRSGGDLPRPGPTGGMGAIMAAASRPPAGGGMDAGTRCASHPLPDCGRRTVVHDFGRGAPGLLRSANGQAPMGSPARRQLRGLAGDRGWTDPILFDAGGLVRDRGCRSLPTGLHQPARRWVSGVSGPLPKGRCFSVLEPTFTGSVRLRDPGGRSSRLVGSWGAEVTGSSLPASSNHWNFGPPALPRIGRTLSALGCNTAARRTRTRHTVKSTTLLHAPLTQTEEIGDRHKQSYQNA